MALKTKLLDHQIKTKEFGIKTKFFGDFSHPGTGKSLSTLAMADALKVPTLIVCPPSLIANWKNEIQKHTDLVLSTDTNKPNGDIALLAYSKIKEGEQLFKWAEFIMCDEAHYLKNLEAKRTVMFHNFFYDYTPKYFNYATGTPINNRIPEIYSMLMLFSKGPNKPHILEAYPSFYTFCCRFTNVRQTAYGTKFEGMKNVDELRKYVNPFTIRHKADLLNLPELQDQTLVVSYKEDKELQEQFDAFLDKGIKPDAKAKSSSASATAPYTAGIIKELLEQDAGPIVCFSDHRNPLNIIELELTGKRVKQITGDISTDKRQEYCDLLNKGQIDVLLCSIGAASEGLNMTGSSIVILNDPPWQPKDLEQLVKRIHRIGQTKPCRFIKIIGSKPVEYIYKVLEKKSKVITKVVEER